jgi:5-bromo-4-chloroindolyl phosphate hydrolysis protein
VDSVFYEGAFNDAAKDVEDAVREVRTEAANVIKEVKSELSDVFSVFKSDESEQSAKRQNADSKREQAQQNQTQRTRTQYSQTQHSQHAQHRRTQTRKSYGNSAVKGGPSRVLSVVLLVIAIIQMAFGARAIFNAVGSFIGDGGGLTELFLGAFYVLGGIICLGASFWLVQRIRRFKTLHTLISTQGIVDITELAKVSGASKRSVIRDVETMINKGYFGHNAYLDKGVNCIILSEAAAQAARNYADTSASGADKTGSQNSKNEFMAIIVELRELNLAIADVNISKKVDRIEELTAKIFRIVEGDSSKRPRIDRFLSYYLPTTQKLLRSYATFEKQGVKGENISAAKENIGNTLDALIKGYELQLDQLFESDAMDIAAEISVLENLMKQDGLSEK